MDRESSKTNEDGCQRSQGRQHNHMPSAAENNRAAELVSEPNLPAHEYHSQLQDVPSTATSGTRVPRSPRLRQGSGAQPARQQQQVHQQQQPNMTEDESDGEDTDEDDGREVGAKALKEATREAALKKTKPNGAMEKMRYEDDGRGSSKKQADGTLEIQMAKRPRMQPSDLSKEERDALRITSTSVSRTTVTALRNDKLAAGARVVDLTVEERTETTVTATQLRDWAPTQAPQDPYRREAARRQAAQEEEAREARRVNSGTSIPYPSHAGMFSAVSKRRSPALGDLRSPSPLDDDAWDFCAQVTTGVWDPREAKAAGTGPVADAPATRPVSGARSSRPSNASDPGAAVQRPPGGRQATPSAGAPSALARPAIGPGMPPPDSSTPGSSRQALQGAGTAAPPSSAPPTPARAENGTEMPPPPRLASRPSDQAPSSLMGASNSGPSGQPSVAGPPPSGSVPAPTWPAQLVPRTPTSGVPVQMPPQQASYPGQQFWDRTTPGPAMLMAHPQHPQPIMPQPQAMTSPPPPTYSASVAQGYSYPAPQAMVAPQAVSQPAGRWRCPGHEMSVAIELNPATGDYTRLGGYVWRGRQNEKIGCLDEEVCARRTWVREQWAMGNYVWPWA